MLIFRIGCNLLLGHWPFTLNNCFVTMKMQKMVQLL